MTADDVIAAIQSGNTAALQWYVLTHPASTNLQNVTSTASGTTITTVGSSQTVIVLVVLAVAAFVLLK